MHLVLLVLLVVQTALLVTAYYANRIPKPGNQASGILLQRLSLSPGNATNVPSSKRLNLTFPVLWPKRSSLAKSLNILPSFPSLPSFLSLPSFPSRQKSQWVDICRKTAINPGSVTPVSLQGLNLLVVAPLEVNNAAKELYIIENQCPHLSSDLSLGVLSVDKNAGDCITCPLHKTMFSLETGCVVGPWCPYPPVVGSVAGLIRKEKNEYKPLFPFLFLGEGKDLKDQERMLRKFEVRTTWKTIQVRILSEVDVDA